MQFQRILLHYKTSESNLFPSRTARAGKKKHLMEEVGNQEFCPSLSLSLSLSLSRSQLLFPPSPKKREEETEKRFWLQNNRE